MKISATPMVAALLALGACSATVRPPEFSSIEYLMVKAPMSANVPVATLREAAIRQAMAACQHNHQAFRLIDDKAGPAPNTSFTDNEIRVQELKDADARSYTSAGISFRCVSGPSTT